MSTTRKDEPEACHFRSDRLVVINGAWFVATREGIDVGPFSTRQRAEAASAELKQVLSIIKDPKTARRFVREFESHVMQTGRTPILLSSGSKSRSRDGLAARLQPQRISAVPIPMRVRRWLGD